MPTRTKDPRSFTIPCNIGKDRFEKVLRDLDTSINLMPLSIFKKLKIGTIRLTKIAFQMADCSIYYPKGVFENVLVKVNDLIFSGDS